uniref:Helicase ATP-binding domain-containing protein n=1 Tax=Populus trichocarpa TaxID=3694 RepID=B9GX03_POPTR
MSTYKIRRIEVDFPLEADDCQLVYMEKKIIQSLHNRCNALLESPAATRKTPCLLCPSLAWRKSLGGYSTAPEDSNLPILVYASRTHSQLRQVIQEDQLQLCVHEEVSLLRGKVQNNTCHLNCRKREKYQCSHYSRAEVKPNPHLVDEPVDIEDLVDIGRTFGPCPYIPRELHKVNDLLFAPYNYLIDRGNKKSLTIDWDNNRLIFDEAFLLKLEKRIAEVSIESKELGFTKPGSYIYELLADLNIANDTATKTIDII